MEITEAKVYEAFGLTPPEQDTGEGAQGQEVAAPAQENPETQTETGAQEQEPAAPAESDAHTGADGQNGPEPESGVQESNIRENGTGKEALTPEQRRENAARRRAQEQQAAVNQAVAAARREEQAKYDRVMQDFFAQVGLKNPDTGEAITSMEQFNAWKQAHDAQQINQSLKAGKLTAEQLNQIISNHPAVRQAQQVVQQAQTEQARQQEAADRERIDGEIAEIGKMDPSIHSVGDLLKMPKAAQFRELVGKGYSFLDAYRLANFDEITAKKAEAAKLEAMNNQRGKDHLNAMGNPRGDGSTPIPSEQMRMFRAINPNATEAQIREFYQKYKSSQGGK